MGKPRNKFIAFFKLIPTFTALKKLITISILLFGLKFSSIGQIKSAPIADNFGKIVKFYPNPAISVINFEFATGFDKTYSLQVFNFMGKKVYETVPTTPAIYLSLDGFFRGVYIYQLRDKFGKIVDSGKFQVVK